MTTENNERNAQMLRMVTRILLKDRERKRSVILGFRDVIWFNSLME